MSSIPENVIEQENSWDAETYAPAAAGPFSHGYLQEGPVFHGRHLNASQLTATERAMRLQGENVRLKDSTARKHQELMAKTRELADLQLKMEKKSEDQRQAMDRIAALNREVTRLNSELNRQIELRLAMEKRMNDQLQSIETMLDGVLMKSMSETRPTADRQ
jgi:chromosome segregation ATPase